MTTQVTITVNEDHRSVEVIEYATDKSYRQRVLDTLKPGESKQYHIYKPRGLKLKEV